MRISPAGKGRCACEKLTEAFHVDSRFTAWSHSRPGSPSFRQLNDALCDRYRGRIFADDQPEPSQRSFEARRHTRDVFWPKRMIAFEKGWNWHIRPCCHMPAQVRWS